MIDTDPTDVLTTLNDIRKAVSLAVEETIFRLHGLPIGVCVLKFPISSAVNEEFGDTLQDNVQLTVDQFVVRKPIHGVKVIFNRNQRPPLYFLMVQLTFALDSYGEPLYCGHMED